MQAKQKDNVYAALEVSVVRAKDLPKMDLNGEADPFVVAKLGEKTLYTTRIIKKTRQPEWNETFRFLVLKSEKDYNLEFHLYDDDLVSNDYIGTVMVDLSILCVQKHHTAWHTVTGKKNKSRGEIHLKFQVYFKEDVEAIFWRSVYDFFDINKDGSITKLELSGLLEGIGSSASDDELDLLFDRFDVNKDGEISFDELLSQISGDSTKIDDLVKRLLPKDKDLPWNTFLKGSNSEQVISSLVLNSWNQVLEIPAGEKGKRKAAEIFVHDRATGKLVEEKIPNYIKVAMRLMYSGGARFAVDSKQVKKLLKSMTLQQGKKYNSPSSTKDILPFISFHNLATEEMLDSLESFGSFNEFFYRKLKPSFRPIAFPLDSKIAVSPADSRLHVYPTIKDATDLWIKGQNFTLASLLQDSELARRHEGGSLVVSRLAPQDYHRFHMPVTATLREPVPIKGTYYTVNPVAVNTSVDVYCENKRVICPMDSPEFGLVTFVAIGATMVGSVRLTVPAGRTLNKGDELGYFAFGGSTVLLLFEPGRIVFDEDLVINSSKPLETLVKMGVSIGRAAV